MKKLKMLVNEVWNVFIKMCRKNEGVTTSATRVQQVYEKKESMAGDPLQHLETFLLNHFDFRYNLLTEETEYREKAEPAQPFSLVSQRILNSLCIKARRVGINCWDRDVARYVCSDGVTEYHPFRLFMDNLPQWDGTDRLRPLAERVSKKSLWIDSFGRWMLGLAAQWMELDSTHGNSVAPVLVSLRQGRQKSTFCKILLPLELQAHYTDSFDLNSPTSAEQKLSAFGLINLGEMDKYSPKKMATLKNLMQMAGLNIRKAHKKSFSPLPRMASFIGTSNVKELLTDPTGSRRFLCVEVDEKIDCSPIDHAQLYAQLKEALLSGERYWFTSVEEAEIMKNNLPFNKTAVEEDVFRSCFRIPAVGEKHLLLSAADIFQRLKKHNSSAMQGINANVFSHVLTALKVEKVHQSTGNVYRVVNVKE